MHALGTLRAKRDEKLRVFILFVFGKEKKRGENNWLQDHLK